MTDSPPEDKYFGEKELPQVLESMGIPRFIVLEDKELLPLALRALHKHVEKIYKPTAFNIVQLDNGHVAIGSADSNFFMGIGENSLLYKPWEHASRADPIPNYVADAKDGKIEQVRASNYTVSVEEPQELTWTERIRQGAANIAHKIDDVAHGRW
ncbi:MAG: hypothetical protein IT567_04295 [Alphaproteobacteria bacterium]|nr:hypothetical protein [Alphaproteobacteria bacterium]